MSLIYNYQMQRTRGRPELPSSKLWTCAECLYMDLSITKSHNQSDQMKLVPFGVRSRVHTLCICTNIEKRQPLCMVKDDMML